MKEWLISYKDAAPAIAACIALLSALVAFGAFIYTRRANRRRATLDMVMKTLLDETFQNRYMQFKDVIRRDQDGNDCFKIESLAVVSDENKLDRALIIQQLNSYELISLGIRHGLFHEMTYKLWFHGQFMTDFKALSQFIGKIQETKPTVYCEYSALYAKWFRDGHPQSAPGRWKMMWWSLWKDNAKITDALTRANP
jgi:hypothetical protein